MDHFCDIVFQPTDLFSIGGFCAILRTSVVSSTFGATSGSHTTILDPSAVTQGLLCYLQGLLHCPEVPAWS